MTVLRGRNFLHCPGPTNLPERVLRAMHRAAMLYPSADLDTIINECCDGLRRILKTEQLVVMYASSGHGAWEAALVNTLSAGDRVIVLESGAFSFWWKELALALGIEVDYLAGDWRRGIDAEALEARLTEDRAREVKAVLMVHTDTASGVTNDCAAIRAAIDRAGHPALFMVDTIAALATCDFKMDEWRIDVAVCGSQKGLMLPPGIGFLGVSEKAFHASQSAGLPRDYWDWRKRSPDGRSFRFCGTAPEQIVFGMRESIDMLFEEGLDNVFARHKRLAEAVRRAVTAWGEAGAVEVFALEPRLQANSITTVLLTGGHAPEPVRQTCHERLNVSLGAGLLHLRENCFRIGHLGDLNEPMVLGALGAIEMALEINGVPHGRCGVGAAIDYLAAA